MNELKNRVNEIEAKLSALTVTEGLLWLSREFPGAVCYSTAFGLEGQVITHFVFKHRMDIKIFTVDTGRNFQETYNVWRATNDKYGQKIETYFPDAESVQKMMNEKGPNSFYDSAENRKECCYIRKVEPLERALKGQKVWLSGLRAEQSTDRAKRKLVEWDEKRQLLKVYPLFHWTLQEVKELIRTENIPYNELYDKGFLSIGCLPCTRAVRAGESERSGRWWWEGNTDKECGIHSNEPAGTGTTDKPGPTNWTI